MWASLLQGGLLLAAAGCPAASTPGPAAAGPPHEPPPAAAARTPTPEPPPPAAALPAQTGGVPASPRPYLVILKLQKAGASQEELLQRVRAENVRFDLTTAEILELRQAGVSEAVVAAMLRSGR